MPMVEILDGPPEWAGAVDETDEDMVADEIGMSHPGWRGPGGHPRPDPARAPARSRAGRS